MANARIGGRAVQPKGGKRAKTLTAEAWRATASEADRQSQIVQGLEALGRIVIVTSRHRKRCEHCGEFSTRPDGVTEGCPDLFTAEKGAGNNWKALEVKKPGGSVRKEQKAMVAAGAYPIVFDLDGALEALR